MTTMDSDSESQDSDDGRRFRFEATRKDNAQQDNSQNRKLSKQRSKSKRESRYDDSDYKDRKERSRHESSRKEREYRSSKDRDTDGKDLRHTKYSKHESRGSRHEDHRDARDSSLTAKNSSVPSKHARDSKRHRNRDRSEHRKHSSRSQERSQDKHRNKSHEKYKRHSRDRSRDRGYQSHKSRSSDHTRSRADHPQDRHNSHKRTKDDEAQHVKDNSSPKNTDQLHNDSESPSKRDLSVDSQEYKDLDLSEFDVLSETDENLSDGSDIKSQSSFPRHHKVKVKKLNSNDDHENSVKRQATESERYSEERHKVNAGKNDPLSGSSNNNPSAISDSLLGTASSVTSAMSEDHTNDLGKIFNRHSDDETVNLDNSSKEESSNSVDACSHSNSRDAANEASGSLLSPAQTRDSAYGPALPPQFTAKSPGTSSNKEKSSCASDCQTNSDDHLKSTAFIGPSLPSKDVDVENIIDESEDAETFAETAVEDENTFAFGPALPPHLMLQKSNSGAQTKIIGPALPGTFKSLNNTTETKLAESEDEEEDVDEDAIGPLPVDHPALKNSYVHMELEYRAQQIKDEQKEEDNGVLKQREEWMTELPSAQASNLGLGPRKFRLREGPDMSDRSCWTDTPAKKAEKQRQREREKHFTAKPPDAECEKESIVSESGKSRKREKTLLEIHQSKLRKKKKKEEKEAKLTGQTVRRPFDRDIDLKVNQFDQAQKNAILRKAQFLEDRFSRGKI